MSWVVEKDGGGVRNGGEGGVGKVEYRLTTEVRDREGVRIPLRKGRGPVTVISVERENYTIEIESDRKDTDTF